MSGVVIRLEPPDARRGFPGLTGILVRVEESPFPGIDQSIGRLKAMVRRRSTQGDAPVQQEGKRLADWIRRDEAIRTVIDRVRERGNPPSVPIQLLVLDDVAHTLAWETLYVDGFLALNELSPIARIPRGVRFDVRDPTRALAIPVRITSVISASGVSAFKQWVAVHDAVKATRENGLPTRLTIITAEQKVITAAGEKAKTDPWLKVVPVPGPNAPVPLLEVIRRASRISSTSSRMATSTATARSASSSRR